jgi:hypothetical protein
MPAAVVLPWSVIMPKPNPVGEYKQVPAERSHLFSLLGVRSCVAPLEQPSRFFSQKARMLVAELPSTSMSMAAALREMLVVALHLQPECARSSR